MPTSRPHGHVIRVALLFAFGLVAFLSARTFFVPADFGKLGFYRAGALDEIQALPLKHAGHEACEVCHGAVVEERGTSKHAALHCETCHGPQADHAANVQPLPAKIADPRTLCLRCHLRIAGKPATFPQVSADMHPVDADCTACHKPHHPELPHGD